MVLCGFKAMQELRKMRRKLPNYKNVHISHTTNWFLWNLLYKTYEYVEHKVLCKPDKIELICLEIQGAELGDFMLPANNTL